MGILIIGGNEWVNKNLCKSLLELNYDGNIKLGIKTNEMNHYKDLSSKINRCEFDYNIPETFKNSTLLQGIDKVFMSNDSADLHAYKTIQSFIQHIKHGGQTGQIKRLIYLSTLAIDNELPTVKCEEEVSSLGINYIILRPTVFLDNFATHMKFEIKNGELFSACGDGRTAWVTSQDVSMAAAILLVNDEKFKLYQFKRVPLTNSKTLSLQDIINIFNQKLNKQIHISNISSQEFDENMIKIGQPADSSKFVTLVNIQIEKNNLNQVDNTLEDLLNHKPISAEQYITSNLSIWK